MPLRAAAVWFMTIKSLARATCCLNGGLTRPSNTNDIKLCPAGWKVTVALAHRFWA